MIALGMVVLLISCFAVSAEKLTDGTGDVHHWVATGGVGHWETTTVNRPNIDITEINHTIVGSSIKFTMKVAGVIQNSSSITYIIRYNSTSAMYWMEWENGDGGGIVDPQDGHEDEGSAGFHTSISAKGNTFSCTFTVIGPDATDVDFWGVAREYTVANDPSQEWWMDVAPDSHYTFENPDDTQVPSQVTGLTVTDVHDGKLTLSWNPATDNVAVDHYRIYRNSTFFVNTAGTSYQDTGLTNNVTYTYQISAIDTSGNEGNKSASVPGTPTASGGGTDTQPPSQVLGLTVIDANNGKLNLVWSPATDNVAVDHYKIYKNNIFFINSTATSYQDTGLTNDLTYTYQVSAVDTSGNEGSKSAPVTGTPTASGGTDTEPPSQVTGLSVANAHDGKLNLSWDAATDNVAVDHYKIYRDNIFLLNWTTTSYQDTGLNNGQTYVYAVSAVDTSGNEGKRSDNASRTPTASGGTTGTKTPGFELLLLIGAVILVLAVVHRKKF